MSDSGPLLSPPCGPVRGWWDGDVQRATGIRYARAERFAPPVPEPDHTGTVDATAWSPACPQPPVPLLTEVLGEPDRELGADEHCQRLSVTMPAGVGPTDRLPVMVWIHGGSYTSGAADLAVMDPRSLVAEQRVIVVAVTYRLGLFGFLGNGDGGGGGGDHEREGDCDRDGRRPANLGLLDLIEAFRWVRRNIAAFGGDPDSVTAFGQSAGGDAIAYLLATEDPSTLFDRAIIQSAPLGLARGRGRRSAALARAAGHVPADAPVEDVLAAQDRAARIAMPRYGMPSAMPFAPQTGHPPLPPEDELDAAHARSASVPLLIGTTAEEAALFLPRFRRVDALSRSRLGRPVRRRLIDRFTRLIYDEATDALAQGRAEAGGIVHRYVLTWSAPGNPYGSAHTIDLPLLFGDRATWKGIPLVDGARWEEIEQAGRRVRAVWATFARGEDLGEQGELLGVLRWQRVRSVDGAIPSTPAAAADTGAGPDPGPGPGPSAPARRSRGNVTSP